VIHASADYVSSMSQTQRKRRTLLHFGSDRIVLILRGWILNDMGYRVLNSSDRREAIQLLKRVDAAILDVAENFPDTVIMGKEMKRCRPELPTIVPTDGNGPADGIHKLVDALVPKRDNPELLATALQTLVPAGRQAPFTRSKKGLEIVA